MAGPHISFTTDRRSTAFDAASVLRQLQALDAKYALALTALAAIGVTIVSLSVQVPTTYVYSYLGVQYQWVDLRQLWTVTSPDSMRWAALQAILADQVAGESFLAVTRYGVGRGPTAPPLAMQLGNPLNISSLGEYMSLVIQQGATFAPVLATMLNPDGTAVDLTGCTLYGAIRKTGLSTTVEAAVEVTITAPTQGKYQFGFSSTATAAIPAGEFLESPESQHVWDFYLRNAQGKITPVYYGPVQVRRVGTPAP